MPALSPTMEEGTLAKWLVAPGAQIRAGDLIAEIETDKASMEMEATEDGILDRILVAEGSADVAVGTVIALLRPAGEAGAAAPSVAPASEPAAAPEAAPAPAPVAAVPATPASVPQAPVSIAAPPPPPVAVDGGSDVGVLATPLARRIAAVRGIALSAVKGTGPGGRITKADVAPSRPPPSAPSEVKAEPARAPAKPPEIPHEAVKLSTMRRTIARRLTESKTTVPHFYISNDCRLDALLALRRELNAALGDGARLSINDLLIKALALALKRVPAANVQYGDDVLYRFDRVDISVAVAIDGGLVTPVIREACSKSASRISSDMRDLAARARAGRLGPEDYQGGTASLSNLGMYGAREIIPVINPPQAVIIGVGAGRETPVFGSEGLERATLLTATGSFDHRAIDGAAGAELMQAFQQLVEAPLTILA
ncbi:pyruvate dehydrogenase complex dihydrolipoamide acetyltransferase [Phenylobacterium sp.]|uniref:pyruvate dehydrogenase complex dihydrolipoamide acetyltransferase n=1 Tax=Phenylobacterium sp. TaxID=1871053 RepID=UPI002811A652|nr:pyruvate dehydrogenase complex dihydrolipoamide acetyltransferase [Phenylobacterium sp.]